jgi:hypothetical protein
MLETFPCIVHSVFRSATRPNWNPGLQLTRMWIDCERFGTWLRNASLSLLLQFERMPNPKTKISIRDPRSRLIVTPSIRDRQWVKKIFGAVSVLDRATIHLRKQSLGEDNYFCTPEGTPLSLMNAANLSTRPISPRPIIQISYVLSLLYVSTDESSFYTIHHDHCLFQITNGKYQAPSPQDRSHCD